MKLTYKTFETAIKKTRAHIIIPLLYLISMELFKLSFKLTTKRECSCSCVAFLIFEYMQNNI